MEKLNDCLPDCYVNSGGRDLWSKEQMIAFRAAGVAAERERCAKACRDKAAEWLKRADAGEMPRDTARHANIAAGQIETAILRA